MEIGGIFSLVSVFGQNISVLREAWAWDNVTHMCCYKLERPLGLCCSAIWAQYYRAKKKKKTVHLCPLTRSPFVFVLFCSLCPFPLPYTVGGFAFSVESSLGSVFGGADILESVMWRWNLFRLEQSVSLLISLGVVCCLAMKSRLPMKSRYATHQVTARSDRVSVWSSQSGPANLLALGLFFFSPFSSIFCTCIFWLVIALAPTVSSHLQDAYFCTLFTFFLSLYLISSPIPSTRWLRLVNCFTYTPSLCPLSFCSSVSCFPMSLSASLILISLPNLPLPSSSSVLRLNAQKSVCIFKGMRPGVMSACMGVHVAVPPS